MTTRQLTNIEKLIEDATERLADLKAIDEKLAIMEFAKLSDDRKVFYEFRKALLGE